MQISGRTRSIALGTAAGVSLALSGTALAVALGGDDDHGGDRADGGGRRRAAAAQQGDGPGAQQGYGDQGPGDQQGSAGQQSAPSGPPMQSGAS